MFNIYNVWPFLWNLVNEDTPKTANITRVKNFQGNILNIPFIDRPGKKGSAKKHVFSFWTPSFYFNSEFNQTSVTLR